MYWNYKRARSWYWNYSAKNGLLERGRVVPGQVRRDFALRRELPVWCLRSAQYRVHVACSPFETVSPRNLAEISAGPTATRNQNGRSNPRLRRPTLPTVTILFFRPFQIRKVEAVLD